MEKADAVDQLTRTAFHEAGHAVIGFFKGMSIGSTAIEPQGEYLGRTGLAWEASHDKEWHRNFVLFTLAGQYAEERLIGGPDKDS